MKPTKNCVYCPECRRTKMLFESEAKANNFMRFNSEEIEELNGKAPTRAYFCEACAGWHLTSSENNYASKYTATQRVVFKANQMREEYKKQKKLICLRNTLNHAHDIISLVQEENYRDAFIVLTNSVKAINEYKKIKGEDTSEFQTFLEEAPEIADIILSKMYGNLQAMNNSDVGSEEKWKNRHIYQKSITTIGKLGDCFTPCFQKHVKLLRSV